MCIRDAEERHDFFLYFSAPHPFLFLFPFAKCVWCIFLWITGYDREFGITPTPQLGDMGWRRSVPLWGWYDKMLLKSILVSFLNVFFFFYCCTLWNLQNFYLAAYKLRYVFCTTLGLCSTPDVGQQDVDLLRTKMRNFISSTFLSTKSNLDHQFSFTQMTNLRSSVCHL